MKLEDQGGYKNYLRMTGENFLELLTIVKGDLEKQSTQNERGYTCKYETGSNHTFLVYQSILYRFTICLSYSSKQVYEALYKNMKTQYLKVCFYLFSTKNTSHSYTLDFANLKYLVY